MMPEKVEKPEPAKRSLKKYSSFETWIQGSPHDSDEYDTDVDCEDYVRGKCAKFNKRCTVLHPVGYYIHIKRSPITGIFIELHVIFVFI